MNGMLCGLLAVVTVASMNTSLAAGPRAARWQRVEEAVQKGLPQTALAELKPILEGALAERAWAEAVKAIARKIVLESGIEGNRPEERVRRLTAELAQAPEAIQPVLEAVLAHWYWHYFQQNRWRFMRRTATAQAPGADFTTWDLPRLFAEIDRHFTRALAAAPQLKAIPIATYDALLARGTVPDAYRPTLYDFIAQEALSFYTSGEQAAALPEDAFEVAAESPIIGTAGEFLEWQPATTDTQAPAFKAIRLYQELLRFHQADADRSAFLDADLARLVWGKNVARGEARDGRVQAALERFAKENGDHELASLALWHEAQRLRGEGDYVQARLLALRGQQAHPASAGGRLCANLVAEIESRGAELVTERAWGAPWPKIQVRYRNVTRVYFRVVGADWDAFLDRRRRRPERLSDAERFALVAQQPVHEWSEALAPTTDFKFHTVELPVPTELKSGYYFLIASHDVAFRESNNQLAMTDFWVSDLALVIRPRSGQLDGFVLWAKSGEPIAGARVQGWYLDRQGNRVEVPETATDGYGQFALEQAERRGYLLKASYSGQAIATSDEYAHWPRADATAVVEQTVFFTDRALYRPGQTVAYKGICLRVDQERDNYQVLRGRSVTVTFADANGKEIAQAVHRCNDYGSFSGSFTAPRDRLLGQMYLHVTQGPPGAAQLSVEEYKRPKFQVTLQPPETGNKLGQRVVVRGQAMSYTGAAVDGALAKYWVVREVRMPGWWGWGGGGRRLGPAQGIAYGTTRTGTDGSFQVEFVARPDLKVAEQDEPTFVFSVHADVTDSAGETRSADRAVRLGYTAIEARLSAELWQTVAAPVAITVRTTTLDGEPQVAEGVVKIHALQPPAQAQRPSWFARRDPLEDSDQAGAPGDASDPNHWPLGEVVATLGFTTDASGQATLAVRLPEGVYRALLESQDRHGKKVTDRLPLRVLAPAGKQLGIRVPHLLEAPRWSVEPGEEFTALWGTGYESGRAFIEIEHRQQFLQRYWTAPGETQVQVQQAVTEAQRGGFTLHVTFVRENRAYLESRHVEVPWSNKELTLRWEHFTSKLEPAQKETWTIAVSGREATGEGQGAEGAEGEGTGAMSGRSERAVAELVAALYDASLDAFRPHDWPSGFGVFRGDYSVLKSFFGNAPRPLQPFKRDWPVARQAVEMRYRAFPDELTESLWGYRMARPRAVARGGAALQLDTLAVAEDAVPPPTVAPGGGREMTLSAGLTRSAAPVGDMEERVAGAAESAGAPERAAQGPDLSQVSPRRNLNETAFFFPHLTSDANGTVRLTFTVPEALTAWRFLGFAHDSALRAGLIEGRMVTAKELMVQPNPPRFLRESDTLEFSVKVANQSERRQQGTVRLTFNDALTDRSVDELLGNRVPDRAFDIPAKESRGFAWRLTVPDGLTLLTYQAMAAAETVSDGEAGLLPVLARRVLVTESLPLSIRGPAERQFEFEKLLKSSSSDTLRHQGLTVQMVSNPAWYAVLALPYLMEFPYECSEQTFNRLYANVLARTIAQADPKVRRRFDLWKNTAALDSPLEKNQELKAVLLEESPWLRQAQNESQARKHVGLLFDDNRLNSETERALAKLREAQLPDGAWPWFSGGPANDYITLYITTGFGRLRQLGVDLPVELALRSLERLDDWIDRRYRDILAHSDKAKNHLSSTIALYLYGRSFFLRDRPIAAQQREAVDYFLGQARRYWFELGERQSHGHLALALHRFGDTDTAQAIVRSLKERSVTDAELGRYWRETERSWWWYRAPIETQALMIEAFGEVTQDTAAVEECKVWLLKQKQTQDWKTTKATADAVYALLLRGRDLLASDQLVELTVGGADLTPRLSPQGNPPGASRNPVEPGTGFYEVRFAGPEVNPSLGQITVKKADEGVAWGSVHWQYLEDLSRITPYAGTPLKLHKALFVRRQTSRGPVLEAVTGPVAVGDEVVVRLELRVDRDMEYVHLKDQRGSGTEPVNVLSGYRYQDGLAYYESTRDTASHFFIDYLPKGTYVFEYALRVQHRGNYPTGVASIQCLYAPEFNSHSASHILEVK